MHSVRSRRLPHSPSRKVGAVCSWWQVLYRQFFNNWEGHTRTTQALAAAYKHTFSCFYLASFQLAQYFGMYAYPRALCVR